MSAVLVRSGHVTRRAFGVGLVMMLGCLTAGPAQPPSTIAPSIPSAGPFTLTGLTMPGGGPTRISVADGRITAVGADLSNGALVDATGLFVSPAFVDSHVHLAFRPQAPEMAAGGVAAAIDLAAPLPFLADRPSQPRILASGPMVTAVGGYPTQSWGAGGYGLECDTTEAAVAAVDTLADAGAAVIKVPIQGPPALSDAALAATVSRAHARGLKVVAHVLSSDAVLAAAQADVDVLAHTPVEALSDEAVSAWSGRAVISTLRAFGGSDSAIQNLRRLRESGATVLYGTDFGNTRTAGIDREELALLGQAGLDGAAVLASGSNTPAVYWGFEDLGALAPGRAASLLLLDADPHLDPSTLSRPVQVLLDGRPMRQASSTNAPDPDR